MSCRKWAAESPREDAGFPDRASAAFTQRLDIIRAGSTDGRRRAARWP